MPLPPTQTPTWSGLEFNSVLCGDSRWRSWLRHCAKIRKVVGSIPGGIIGIFHWLTPSGRTMAIGSTPPLTKMSSRHISWGVKAAAAAAGNLTTFVCGLSRNLGASTSGNPQGLYLTATFFFFASAIRGRRLPEPWQVRAPFFAFY
jgi:hypothetical protein